MSDTSEDTERPNVELTGAWSDLFLPVKLTTSGMAAVILFTSVQYAIADGMMVGDYVNVAMAAPGIAVGSMLLLMLWGDRLD